MNISKSCLGVFLLSFMGASNAFTIPNSAMGTRSTRTFSTGLRMSSTENEVAALRAAAQKARDEAQRLAKELGKDIDVSSESSKNSSISSEPPSKTRSFSSSEIQSFLKPINFSSTPASEQVSVLNSLSTEQNLSLWNIAATTSANTASPSPLRPYPVSQSFLEQRTGGKITGKSLGVDGEDDVSLDDFKYATIGVTLGSTVLGIASLALLPDNIGATACYAFALVPIGWVAIGSSTPAILAGLIATVRGGGEVEEEKEDRICRHEAAHFLCGYLCGLPVRSYSTGDTGFPCVEFHPCAEGDIQRELTEEEIAVMSVVAMSGSVAEAMVYDEAKGGGNDLIELSGLFKRSKEFLGAVKQQDLTRWGALASYNLLNGNKDAYERLVEAFKEKKTVAECITVIESD